MIWGENEFWDNIPFRREQKTSEKIDERNERFLKRCMETEKQLGEELYGKGNNLSRKWCSQ